MAGQGLVALALAETLGALRGLGRLEDVDAGLVALCESTAAALDCHPERASLVKEYRECLVLLMLTGRDVATDEFAALMAGLSGASVGDGP